MKKIKKNQNHQWPDCSEEGADLSVLQEGWRQAWHEWLGKTVSREILAMAIELPSIRRSC